MDKNASRKEKLLAYKEREIIGGVYAITNTVNGRRLLSSAIDLQGSRNRFDFSAKTGSCVCLKLQNDWAEFGTQAFTFEVLEELTKKAEQTEKEFAEDIKTLEEIWVEKLGAEKLY